MYIPLVESGRLYVIERSLVSYFRNEGALIPENAIKPDISTLASSTKLHKKYIEDALYKQKYIRRIEGSDRFYLDEEKYLQVKRIERMFVIIIILGTGIIILYAYTNIAQLLN